MASEEETTKFYGQLEKQLNGIKSKNNNILIIGDCSSQVGQREKGEKTLWVNMVIEKETKRNGDY